MEGIVMENKRVFVGDGIFYIERSDGKKAWYYDFSYNKKRYIKYAGTTKTQAQRAKEKRRTEVLNEELGLSTKINNPRIEEFSAIFLERRKHMKSIKRVDLSARTLLLFFKGMNMASIEASNIADFIRYRKSMGVSNATVNRDLATLKCMYNYAIKWKDVLFNPMKDVDLLKEPDGRTRYLTLEEAKCLIKNSRDHIKPIIITALNTGLRLGELLNLQWSKVHLNNPENQYIELIKTKNNKTRFIPLNTVMIELLLRLKKESRSEYVFVNSWGERLRDLRTTFQNTLEKSDIKDFRFHDLRHTFASHYLMSGGDLMSLKEILGHSSLKMVQRYAHLASTYKYKMINNLSNKFSEC